MEEGEATLSIPTAEVAADAAATPITPASSSDSTVPAAPSSSASACSCACHSTLEHAKQRAAHAEQQLSRLQEENGILRASCVAHAGGSGGGAAAAAAAGAGGSSAGSHLAMAFKLLERVKEERDQLKRENQLLKSKLQQQQQQQLPPSSANGRSSLSQLLASTDLNPTTRSAILALEPRMQEMLSSELLRWNQRVPTDTQGRPFDLNKRAMHLLHKFTNALPPIHTQGGAQGSGKMNGGGAGNSGLGGASMFSPVSPSSSPEEQTDMQVLRPRKKLVVAKTPEKKPHHHPHPQQPQQPSSHKTPESAARSRASSHEPHSPAPGAEMQRKGTAVFSPVRSEEEEDSDEDDDEEEGHDEAQSPQSSPSSSSSSESKSNQTAALSTSLLSDTNRLLFQEDSPLYRQQLQLQRVRVAQMFSRLDALSEKTAEFARATLAFSQAAASLAEHMARPWEDIETKEVIDEAEAVKMEQKMKAEAAAEEQAHVAAKEETSKQQPPANQRTPSSAGHHKHPSATRPTPSPSPPPPSHHPSASPPVTSASASSVASPPPSSSSTARRPDVDPLSLGFSTSRLSCMLDTLAHTSSNLGQFLDALLVTAINSIGVKYRAEAKTSMLHMERIMAEYEEKLAAYLKKKQADRQKREKMLNIFGKKKLLDEDWLYISALRREMELKRLEHVEVLNSIQTMRRLELVEVVCASLSSFVTFFHEGDFHGQELKKDMEWMAASIPRRKRFYEQHFTEVQALKHTIKNSALPINLAKIFSGSASLPIGFNAAEWVSNVTHGEVTRAPASSPSSSPTSSSSSSSRDKSGGGVNIGHASLIYTIPGIGVAASLSKPAQVQGYLRMHTKDGKEWKRRWHVLEKGQFFYLREAAFLTPQLVVNVLTCGARPCVKSELDFMFELISPTKTMRYQAESEHEMRTWVQVFANSTEHLLSMQQTRNDTEALERQMDVKTIQLQKHVKAGLLSKLRKENPTCAECGSRDSADWVSLNLGVMICIMCSGIHRSLGVHITKVRSLVLDDLDTEVLDMLGAMGNQRANAIWEAEIPFNVAKPTPASAREEREKFIQDKYVHKKFLPLYLRQGGDASDSLSSPSATGGVRDNVSGFLPSERYSGFFKAVETEELEGLLAHLLQGCEVNWHNEEDGGKCALHHAAQHDAILATEFLIQNNADVNATDDRGRTPLDYAKEFDSKRVLARLQGASGKKNAAQASPQ